MPQIKLEIDEKNAIATYEGAPKRVKDALLKALKPLADNMASDAMDRALAHIRFQGKKPGQYLASIYGGVSDNNGRVIGYVRSGNPLAHLLELGATTPAHDIMPKAADVLAFDGDAGTVFAKIVHSPGAVIPPYPAIKPAFDNALSTIETTIEQVVKDALKW